MHQRIENQPDPTLFSENRQIAQGNEENQNDPNEAVDPESLPTNQRDHFAISLNFVMITNLHLQITMILISICCIWDVPKGILLGYAVIPDLVGIKKKLTRLKEEKSAPPNTRKLIMMKLLDSVSSFVFKVSLSL